MTRFETLQPELPYNELEARATRREIKTRRPNGSFKTREIWEPNDELRQKHVTALEYLYRLGVPKELRFAFGGMPGRTLYDNSQTHQDGEEFYLLDLTDAYASVDRTVLRERVAEFLRPGSSSHVYERAWLERFIENDALLEGVSGLPLGLPASPMLCNMYYGAMDKAINSLLNDGRRYRGRPEALFTYTRWIDDITISAKQEGLLTPSVRRAIRECVEKYGGTINHGKSKLYSLKNGPVTITGMSLYPDRRIAPAPRLVDAVTRKLAEAADKLTRGELTWADMDEVNGYKSILHLTKTGSPEHSGSRTVRSLAVRYDEFAREALAALPPRA